MGSEQYSSCVSQEEWRTPLVFVPSGVKINAATYKELVLEPILEDLGEKMFNNQPFVFQQDGAPAHTAKTTQQWQSMTSLKIIYSCGISHTYLTLEWTTEKSPVG